MQLNVTSGLLKACFSKPASAKGVFHLSTSPALLLPLLPSSHGKRVEGPLINIQPLSPCAQTRSKYHKFTQAHNCNKQCNNRQPCFNVICTLTRSLVALDLSGRTSQSPHGSFHATHSETRQRLYWDGTAGSTEELIHPNTIHQVFVTT